MTENVMKANEDTFGDISKVAKVEVLLCAELGKARMSLQDIIEYDTGSIITLDKLASDPINIYVNDILIAKGEIVAVEDTYGIKIVELVNKQKKISKMPNLLRYKQNMISGGITQEAQERLLQSRVLVFGAGGLGSGVIMNLAAMGVGYIKLVDDGIVKEEDLNRQIIHKYKNISRARVISAKDWIQEYNSDVKVEIQKIKLNEINYFNAIQGYDILVDCFNSYESDYMLNEIAVRHNIPLVYGGIQAHKGQVTTIHTPETGCLECVMQKPKLFKDEKYASFSPAYNVISSLMAAEVFKLITETGEPLFNRLITYDAMKSEFKTFVYEKNKFCNCCAATYVLE